MCSQQNVLFKTVLNVRKDCITEDFFSPSSTASVEFVGKLEEISVFPSPFGAVGHDLKNCGTRSAPAFKIIKRPCVG